MLGSVVVAGPRWLRSNSPLILGDIDPTRCRGLRPNPWRHLPTTSSCRKGGTRFQFAVRATRRPRVVAKRRGMSSHQDEQPAEVSRPLANSSQSRCRLIVPYVVAGWVNPVSRSPTIRELSGRLHFLSVGRYAVKVRPLLVDNIRFRLVNKPGCQHEKIGACVPLTTIIGV